MPANCMKAAKCRGCSQSASLDAQWKARQQWPFPICTHAVAVRRHMMGERLSVGGLHQQTGHAMRLAGGQSSVACVRKLQKRNRASLFCLGCGGV